MKPLYDPAALGVQVHRKVGIAKTFVVFIAHILLPSTVQVGYGLYIFLERVRQILCES